MGSANKASRKVAFLACCNVLWGFIPWPAKNLFAQFSSFLIIFSRFLTMAITLFAVVTILILWINRKASHGQQRIGFKDLMGYLAGKNKEFFNLPQWAYLAIVAVFGLNFMTILFFWSLSTIGAITTAIGVIISLVIVTGINWGLGKEEITKFKLLYLTTLIVAAIILGSAGGIGLSTPALSFSNFVVVFIYGISISVFVITSGRDHYSKREYESVKKNRWYKMIRTLLKLAVLSLFSAITYIPIFLLLNLLPLNSAILDEIGLFFSQLTSWWHVLKSWDGIILIFVCTIIPYLLYYTIASKWPKHISFDLWVGVLQLIEPIINIVLGITILQEPFPPSWLAVIIFLLSVAIITKYLSETEAQIFAIILLKVSPNAHQRIMQEMYRVKAVRQVGSLIGDYDIMLYCQINSSKALNALLQTKITPLEGLTKYDFLIITDIVLDGSEKKYAESKKSALI